MTGDFSGIKPPEECSPVDVRNIRKRILKIYLLGNRTWWSKLKRMCSDSDTAFGRKEHTLLLGKSVKLIHLKFNTKQWSCRKLRTAEKNQEV